MAEATETRIKRMMRLIRVSTSAFMLLPLLGWSQLRHPWLAAVAAAAAIAEAVWFDRRAARAKGPLEPAVVLVDAGFCVLLMLAGSQAAVPELRNVVMTELVPFSLGSAAVVGVSRVNRPLGLLAVAALMGAWYAAVFPDVRLKLASDLLGFALWYLVGRRIAVTWRDLAEQTSAINAESEDRLRTITEQRQAETEARHRDELHRAIHDLMLPVVHHVASGGAVGPAEERWALRTAVSARRWLEDPRYVRAQGLRAALAGVIEVFTDRGLIITETLITRREPPPAVINALEGAVTEALNNVVRHAGERGQTVVLFAKADEDGVVVTVQDRGVGFDRDGVPSGGGLRRSLRSIEHYGGRVTVDSRPGRGTKVRWEWRPAGADAPGTPDASGAQHGSSAVAEQGGVAA
ncbi:ATP-binding protein [Kitasatospora sp. NPDC049285]|uniref:sensor histidine kinase n=1 Tax=Kitasatospora sp. NPDC049285 TaxID=3157096 RepID=UPI003423E7E5